MKLDDFKKLLVSKARHCQVQELYRPTGGVHVKVLIAGFPMNSKDLVTVEIKFSLDYFMEVPRDVALIIFNLVGYKLSVDDERKYFGTSQVEEE